MYCQGYMDDEVRRYIDAIPAGHRPLYDRLHDLIVAEYPGGQDQHRDDPAAAR